MRRIFFSNFYLATVGTGIQAGHAAEEMWAGSVRNYLTDPSTSNRAILNYLLEFAEDHKTWIILKGGDHSDLMDLYAFLCDPANKFPVSKFHEVGLNNALTSVSIVLPEWMYDETATACGNKLKAGLPIMEDGQADPNGAYGHFTPWELEFLKRKAMCGLAS